MLDLATRWILSPISLTLLPSRCFAKTNASYVSSYNSVYAQHHVFSLGPQRQRVFCI